MTRPKLRFRDDPDGTVEWREFCACRDGEAALTETLGLWTVSGRSDCPPTGRSNVGFNTRVLDEELAARTMPPVLKALGGRGGLLRDESGRRPRRRRRGGSARPRLRPVLRAVMLRGLERLVQAYPQIAGTGSRLIGPRLEGVGWYPRVDDGWPTCQCGWQEMRAALFRGIVAAMISGRYAADSVLRALGVSSS